MILEIGDCKLDAPFAGIHMRQLSDLFSGDDRQRLVSIVCNDGRHPNRPECRNAVDCAYGVAPFVACDPCRIREEAAALTKRNKDYWEHVCPEKYRETKTDHPGFPTEIYRQLKEGFVGKGLFLFGPSDTFKTRVAMLMLKRALHAGKCVQVLWPDQIASLRHGFDSSMDRFAKYDVLMLDDPILAVSKDAKLIENLRQLIDIRTRHERPCIITSQIGHKEEIVAAQAYGEAKGADIERIESLLKRFRQECHVVSFDTAQPVPGTELGFL